MGFDVVNWPAVIAGAVAAFAFGWLLYSPLLFGRRWAEGSGVDISGSGPPAGAMIIQVLAVLLLALVVGLTETTNALAVAVAAILATAAFCVANGAFSGKSTFALVIDGVHVVGAGVLMILAQGLL